MARAVTSRPRLILALLLAFLIDTVRPAVQPATHSHQNGDRAHVHLGEVANRNGSGPARLGGDPHRVPEGKAGIARASASGLHVHLLRTLHVSHVAPPWPTPAIASCRIARVAEPRGERTATVHRRSARGPPTITA